jgi:hypothetical protein
MLLAKERFVNINFIRIVLLLRPKWHRRNPLLKTYLNRLNIGYGSTLRSVW